LEVYMTRKSFAFILFVLIGAGVGSAQTPEPKAEKDGAVTQGFTWGFDGAGGYLGVQTEEVSKENLSKYALREVKGVGIESVVEGSPAQTAGLQKGDVIVKVNGEDVTSTRKLTRLIGEISPDHQARLTVLRGGSEREISVTVGKRPGMRFGEGSFQMGVPMERFEIPPIPMPNLDRMPRVEAMPFPPGAPDVPMSWNFGSRRQIGVGVTPLTKQLAGHFGVESGMLVNNVRENSAAAKAGIKAGDIITEVDGKTIGVDRDLARAIGEKKDGSVTLTIIRDRNRQTLTVTPEEVKDGFENHFEFSTPEAPDSFRLTRPAVPSTSFPLNQFFNPGRIRDCAGTAASSRRVVLEVFWELRSSLRKA
jgi:serine protease Do